MVLEPTGSAVSMKCFMIAFSTCCLRSLVILLVEFSTWDYIVLNRGLARGGSNLYS